LGKPSAARCSLCLLQGLAAPALFQRNAHPTEIRVYHQAGLAALQMHLSAFAVAKHHRATADSQRGPGARPAIDPGNVGGSADVCYRPPELGVRSTKYQPGAQSADREPVLPPVECEDPIPAGPADEPAGFEDRNLNGSAVSICRRRQGRAQHGERTEKRKPQSARSSHDYPPSFNRFESHPH